MDTVVFGLACLITLTATAVSVRDAWAKRAQTTYRLARWGRSVSAAVCFIGSALSVPAVADWCADATRVDNIAKLVSHLCAVGFIGGLQVMVADWTYGREFVGAAMRVRLLIAALVEILLTVLFLRGNRPGIEFTTDFADHHIVTGYLLVYLAFGTYGALETCALCFAMARALPNHPSHAKTLRIGLLLVSIGAAATVGYVISKGGYLLANLAGNPWPLAVEKALSSPLAGLSILFILTGLTFVAVDSQRRRSTARTPLEAPST